MSKCQRNVLHNGYPYFNSIRSSQENQQGEKNLINGFHMNSESQRAQHFGVFDAVFVELKWSISSINSDL